MAHRQPEVAVVGRCKIALAAALAIWFGIAGYAGLTELPGLAFPGLRRGVCGAARDGARDRQERVRCHRYRRGCLQHAAGLAVYAQQCPESREPGGQSLQVPGADQSTVAAFRGEAPPDLPQGAQTLRGHDGQAREGDHCGSRGAGRGARVDSACASCRVWLREHAGGRRGPRVGAHEGQVGSGSRKGARCGVSESFGCYLRESAGTPQPGGGASPGHTLCARQLAPGRALYGYIPSCCYGSLLEDSWCVSGCQPYPCGNHGWRCQIAGRCGALPFGAGAAWSTAHTARHPVWWQHGSDRGGHYFVRQADGCQEISPAALWGPCELRMSRRREVPPSWTTTRTSWNTLF